MLDVKAFLYAEALPGYEFSRRVRFITDIASDPVMCKAEELTKAFSDEYHFRLDRLKEIEEKFQCYMPVIINVLTQEIHRYVGEPILVKQEIVRSNKPTPKDLSSFGGISDKIEKIVHGKLFSK